MCACCFNIRSLIILVVYHSLSRIMFFACHSTYVEVLGMCNPDGTIKELKFTDFGENFGVFGMPFVVFDPQTTPHCIHCADMATYSKMCNFSREKYKHLFS